MGRRPECHTAMAVSHGRGLPDLEVKVAASLFITCAGERSGVPCSQG